MQPINVKIEGQEEVNKLFWKTHQILIDLNTPCLKKTVPVLFFE